MKIGKLHFHAAAEYERMPGLRMEKAMRCDAMLNVLNSNNCSRRLALRKYYQCKTLINFRNGITRIPIRSCFRQPFWTVQHTEWTILSGKPWNYNPYKICTVKNRNTCHWNENIASSLKNSELTPSRFLPIFRYRHRKIFST